MPIDNATKTKFAISAGNAVRDVLSLNKRDSNSLGVMFHILHLPLKPPSDMWLGLEPLHESWVAGADNFHKLPKYTWVVREKVIRLAKNLLDFGHVSAWQSRDPDDMKDRRQFGGAGLFLCDVPELGPKPSRVLIAMSGLNELEDDASVALTAHSIGGQAYIEGIHNFLSISNNVLGQEAIKAHSLPKK
ncbi:MAG: hypothetical protein ISR99_03170 [Parcubacteria group bacterium]|nr:hypothetical protein [Parcubacteria group bacterium]